MPTRPPAAHRALRSWIRLESALAELNRDLRERFQLGGLELSLLRAVSEHSPQRLLDLRRELVIHPATLGQAVDRLAERGLVAVQPNPDDGRSKVVALTAKGSALLSRAPLAGPARLRSVGASESKLVALAAALDDAMELFDLTSWAPDEIEPDTSATPIEDAVNIGPVLGRELREAGVASLEQLRSLGHRAAWRKLHRVAPERDCAQSCLALAGAIEGVRWTKLPEAVRAKIESEAAKG